MFTITCARGSCLEVCSEGARAAGWQQPHGHGRSRQAAPSALQAGATTRLAAWAWARGRATMGNDWAGKGTGGLGRGSSLSSYGLWAQ